MGILEHAKGIATHELNRDRPAHAVLRYLAWNIGRRLLKADYAIPLVDNVRLIVTEKENYATLLYTTGLWDFAETMFLLHFLRPRDLFVDVGANIGLYSTLASCAAGADCIAIEPVPATFEKLDRNIRIGGNRDRVQLLNLGVGETAAELQFTSSYGGLNRVVRPRDTGDAVTVKVQPLDWIVAGRSPTMMKIDVEGYEMHVLRGARATLSSPVLKALIIELNGSGGSYGSSDDDVHSEIWHHGFRPYRYEPRMRALVEEPSYNKNENNTLYLRVDDDMRDRLASAPKYEVRGRQF
jgi:FkbM family methyltransferase